MRIQMFQIWALLKRLVWVALLGILVLFYFQKERAWEVSRPWIEKSRQSGIVFYAEGIWQKVVGIQKQQENKAKRAIELAGAEKKIRDRAELFSIGIPESWTVTAQEGGRGNQLSRTVVASRDYSVRQEGGAYSYEDGAELSIQVLKGEQPSARAEDGGHGKDLLWKKGIVVGNQSYAYHAVRSPSVKKGQILDLHIARDGKTFLFRYSYDPETYSDGEFTFETIVGSLELGEGE